MKPEPTWLSLDAVRAIHEQLIAEHGGVPGLRELGLLESALAGPRRGFAHADTDLFALAACYANGLTRNHPFVGGNKRAPLMAAYTFLALNGWSLNAPEEQAVAMMRGLADRTLREEELAAWLRVSCVRR